MSKIQLSGKILSSSPEQRTLAGRLVSFGELANPSVGPGTVVIAAGAVKVPEEVGSVVLNVEHDKGIRVGRLMLASEHPQGVDGVFSIVKSTSGDDILAEAKAGLRNGFSIEGDIKKSRRLPDGTVEITELDLTGAAVTWQPAFSSAQIYEIAASMADAAPNESETATVASATPTEEEEIPQVENHIEEVEASVAVVETAPLAAKVSRKAPSLGEYLAAAKAGNLEAVVDPQVLSENPGIVPEFIVGPVIDTRIVERPIVNSARRIALPKGSTYKRPIVTQHPLVGLQADELDELVGQPLGIESVNCTKKTAGGYIPVSVQNRDWTDPAIMSYLGAAMVGSMINFTEAQAAAALVAAATEEELLADNTDPVEWAVAISNAKATVLAGCGAMADTLYVAPDVYAALSALCDTTGRPLFASTGPANVPGSINTPWGVSLVVSQQLASGKAIVGASQFLEFGEDADIQLTTPNAKTLGFDMALGRYFDVYATVDAAFVSLVAVLS